MVTSPRAEARIGSLASSHYGNNLHAAHLRIPLGFSKDNTIQQWAYITAL
jgi:hypothetical protein